MTKQELNQFLEHHTNIEWRDVEDNCIDFRNTNLPWYQENDKHATRISTETLSKMSENDLLYQINKGVDVEGISRITGYFSKTRSWNLGKIAERKDRHISNMTTGQ